MWKPLPSRARGLGLRGSSLAKTADVQQAVWADPWFLRLPPDAKLLFLWAITNEHSNLAGLYVVAEETIRHETKLTEARLSKALEALHPKMLYRPETGTVCVPSRPKHTRVKNDRTAKSIVTAIKECAHLDIQGLYVKKYGQNAWLSPLLDDLALQAGQIEVQQSPTNSTGVPSQSQSQSSKRDVEGIWDHYVATMGKRGRGAELRDDERKIIRDALAAADPDEVKTCITACERSDYHMKRGDFHHRKGGKYNALGTILKPRSRNGETQRSRIEWWLEAADRMEATSGSGWAGFIDGDEDAA